MSFQHLADRVQIVVIEDGSVVVVCCAPRYLMEELVRQASESINTLVEMGVVKLTVGGTEVTIEKDSGSSLKLRKEMTQLPKPLTMTQDYFSLEEETQLPLDINIEAPEKGSDDDGDDDLTSSSQSPRRISLSGQSTRLSSPSFETTNPIFSPGRRYETRKAKAITYFTRLSHPKGMAISQEGHLIVTECWANCITIINTNIGEVINRFGKQGSEQGEFWYPEGVALTQDGHIIVADSFNNRLQVLTIKGGFVAAVGSRGSEPLQFNEPHDVVVHQNGNIFVTDIWNHRVQVLNPDLSYSHCFGSKGDKPGELNEPRGIAIDQDGMVYVSDSINHQIQKFTPEGTFLSEFSTGSLFYPHGLCIDSNNTVILYVADWGSTVCVYNTSGQFLGYIGNNDGSSFDGPHFIVSYQDRLRISDDNGVITYKCYQQ